MSRATGETECKTAGPYDSHRFVGAARTPSGKKRFAPEIPESTGESVASAGDLDVLTPLTARPYTRSDPFRGVAQLVARGVWDAEAGGSSPLTPTCPFLAACDPDARSIQQTLMPEVLIGDFGSLLSHPDAHVVFDLETPEPNAVGAIWWHCRRRQHAGLRILPR